MDAIDSRNLTNLETKNVEEKYVLQDYHLTKRH